MRNSDSELLVDEPKTTLSYETPTPRATISFGQIILAITWGAIALISLLVSVGSGAVFIMNVTSNNTELELPMLMLVVLICFVALTVIFARAAIGIAPRRN